MSEQKQRNYINGAFITQKTFDDGGSLFRLRLLPEKFIASLKTLVVDDEGFATIVMSKSKTPKPGSEFYMYEDDWRPGAQNNKPQSAPTKPVTKAKKVEKVVEQEEELI